ncbi:MAG: D-aminopeptidase [Candidatus Eremiobacteraeota bacterium]|jgi:D-aminopeptidase|nr:D-aminopeptidase [Candidatus Eremiobacteraeota bacterium]
MRRILVLAVALACFALPAAARTPVPIGTFAPGAVDGITDVAGVRVAHVTKIEGTNVRTGATGILAGDDVWNQRVAAATYDLNGNGEMTGAHWVEQSGFLEVPVVLTNTLNVGRVDDGVVSWLIAKHPQIGVRDDVPLPVVAECDDQGINDIQGRHVHAEDVVAMLDAAKPGDFARGNVGAGTGMRAFGFAAGIGSSSRVLPQRLGGYTVGVLVNANTGSRAELRIDGVPVGRALANELLPVYPRSASYAPPDHGRAADGSVIIVVATDAPLDHTRLRDIAKRAGMGLARTGATSHVSSGDLFIAFSTTHRYPRAGGIAGPPLETDEDRIDALFAATVEATESAIDDALFSAHDISGRAGVKYFALPRDRVQTLLKR